MRSTCDHPLLTHRRFGLTGPPVYVDFGVNSGRLGNRLFQAAAALVLANHSGSPVSFASQIADDLAEFPCAQTADVPRRSRGVGKSQDRLQAANGPYHQDLSTWGAGGPHALKRRDGNLTEYGQRRQRCGSVDAAQQAQCGLTTTHWRPMFRRAFATPRLDASMQGITLPERNALVFHFRDLTDCKSRSALEGRGSAGQRATAAVAKSAYDENLRDGSDGKLPPSSFFDAAIALHRQRWPTGHVWIVCQPCERHNPAVLRILHRWPNASTLRLRNGSALKDFAWVRAARHIGIAPSTFGWWAGYLSEARTIYYPALPSSQMPWCLIMPTDDPRYLFVRSKRLPNHGDAALERAARGGTVDAPLARRECLVAQRAAQNDGWRLNKMNRHPWPAMPRPAPGAGGARVGASWS